MISINVRTTVDRRTISEDVTTTPAAVFAELGVDTYKAMVNLDGETLRSEDLEKTFEELGVSDGSTCNLNSIVKADGAIRLATE